VQAGYGVRELNLSNRADVDALFALWDEMYPGVLGGQFDWLYLRNPAGRARVWTVNAADGTTAGAAAVFPRLFQIDGEPQLAGLAGDFLIHPAHRVLGPAIALQRRVSADATAQWVRFLYGFPNRHAEPTFRRVGYETLTSRQRWVVPIRAGAFLPTALGAAWQRVLAMPADLAIHLGVWAASRTSGLSYEVCTDVDERFDDLWKRVGAASRIALHRSSTYLRWRYLDSSCVKYTIIKCLRGSELVGYAVTRMADDVGEVSELIGDSTVRRGLTFRVWQAARAQGAVRLELFPGRDTNSAAGLDRIGYFLRQGEHHALLYAPRDDTRRGELLDRTRWWLMQSDSDT
jgi:hypothetical protein